jgi:outer membrane protein
MKSYRQCRGAATDTWLRTTPKSSWKKCWRRILDLNRRNVEVLAEQLKQTRDRFNVGEVTRTDVAQAESRLAAGRSALLGAQSNYVTSQANYRRVIGVDPGHLAPGAPVDRLSPNTLARAIVQGQQQSPSVLAAMYGVDIAELAVKISEGALYPNLSVTAAASQGWEPAPFTTRQAQASVLGALTVPIYQGGGEYSTIRQSKETVGQQWLNVDVNRDQARATVVQSWGQLDAAKAQIEATTAQVNAAEIALNGVREEARVGQRTTLDVRSRNWLTPALRWSRRSMIGWLRPTRCLRRSACCRCRTSGLTF